MSPSIYVADLSAYNAGKLHGAWIEITDPDTMQEEINTMLENSPEPFAEEYAIHDFEAPFEIHEFDDIKRICELAEVLDEYGDVARAAIELADMDADADTIREWCEERYEGCYDSLLDYAYEYVDSTGYLDDVPDEIARYFDYEAFARDIEISGGIISTQVDGDLHFFRNY